MTLTPWTRRITIVCLSACFFVAVVCRESTLAGMIGGGILAFINPEENKKDDHVRKVDN